MVLTSRAQRVDVTLELLDSSDNFLADVTDQLQGGRISYSRKSRIQFSGRLRLKSAYNWNNQRFRPTITITDTQTGDTQSWVMGVFLPETPDIVVGEAPPTYDVKMWGKLFVLNTPYGASHTVASGTNYVTAVEGLVDDFDTNYAFDVTTSTLPNDLVWSVDQRNTYLRIINELLSGANYGPVYVDRTGTFRSSKYTAPSVKAVSYAFNADSTSTTVYEAVYRKDWFDVPNQWTFIRNSPASAAPTTGDGIYTVINQSSGPASVDQRGRVVNKVVKLRNVADQTTLQEEGDRIVTEDKSDVGSIELTTRPIPSLWHDDVITVTSANAGLTAQRFHVDSWTIPFDGGPMTIKGREVT